MDLWDFLFLFDLLAETVPAHTRAHRYTQVAQEDAALVVYTIADTRLHVRTSGHWCEQVHTRAPRMRRGANKCIHVHMGTRKRTCRCTHARTEPHKSTQVHTSANK